MWVTGYHNGQRGSRALFCFVFRKADCHTHHLVWMCWKSRSLTTLLPANGPWGSVQGFLAGKHRYWCAPDRTLSSSSGNGHPPGRSVRLREGHTWGGDGGGGNPPRQPGRLDQPWQLVGWQMSQPDHPHIPKAPFCTKTSQEFFLDHALEAPHQ